MDANVGENRGRAVQTRPHGERMVQKAVGLVHASCRLVVRIDRVECEFTLDVELNYVHGHLGAAGLWRDSVQPERATGIKVKRGDFQKFARGAPQFLLDLDKRTGGSGRVLGVALRATKRYGVGVRRAAQY